MKKLISVIALVSLLLLVPVVVWVAKPADLHSALVIENNADTVAAASERQDRGAGYVFDYHKIRPTYTSSKDMDYSIDELKDFDAVYLTTEDGYRLSLAEWNKVEVNIGQNDPSLLVAEYGAIQNAESGELAEYIARAIGVKPTGWSGKYVDELSQPGDSDIPDRVVASVGEWQYSGPGLVLNNSLEGKTIVFELGPDAQKGGVGLTRTDKAQELGYKGTSALYDGWFDVIEVATGTDALYNFDLRLTEEQRQQLQASGLPDVMPAVTLDRDATSDRVYLTGHFSQVEDIPQVFQYEGIHHLYAFLQRFSSSNFYWGAFFPILNQTIKTHARLSKPVLEDKRETGQEPASGVTYPARVGKTNDRIEVNIDGTFTPMTVKGVNLGMAKPGYFPGEASITEDEYYTWFEEIGAMNANTVRVYTLHPPGFYRALAKYNSSHEAEIYVLHGVWINEEWITGDSDAYHDEALHGFQREIQQVVDAMHGNALVEHVPGHASGAYAADISDYVIGWVLGTEWDPFMVLGTNEKHRDVGQFDGDYFYTDGASPFEHWLAEQMEFTTNYEVSRYEKARPMSFTNWVTTDILEHPSDTSGQEDIAEVNPNHIHTRGAMDEIGQFASYHVYPYYPDFIRMDQKYANATDWRGESNQYYAYLQELRAAHTMPVLVAEFGIPASRGRTHTGPNDMHQGMESEQEQGEHLTHMYEDILHAGYLGGIVFTWQDEWFKRTWNTMDFDNPERRAFWSNAQTSEQEFGLLSFDTMKVKVDGDVSDWETAPIYSADHSEDPIRDVYVDHDERYLYYRFDLAPGAAENGGYPVALVDTIGGQGNERVNSLGVDSPVSADFMLSMKPGKSQLLVNPYYDLHSYFYGYLGGLVPYSENLSDSSTGEFVPIRYALNKQTLNAETGELEPFDEYEAGALREGNGNPDVDNYNSLADYAWSTDKTKLEVRIPWLLMNFRDPSQREVTSDLWVNQSIYKSEFVDDIELSFVFVDGDGGDEVLQQATAPVRYTWDKWDRFETEHRLKKSYFILKSFYATVE